MKKKEIKWQLLIYPNKEQTPKKWKQEKKQMAAQQSPISQCKQSKIINHWIVHRDKKITITPNILDWITSDYIFRERSREENCLRSGYVQSHR